MNHILPVDFIDVSTMAAGLLLRHYTHYGEEESVVPDTTSIILRGPAGSISGPHWDDDVPCEDKPLAGAWPSWVQVQDQIIASHMRRTGGLKPNFGKIIVEKLEAGHWTNWATDETPYAKDYDRFAICLVPSPGAWVYVGGEGAILPVGQMAYLNHHAPHCALNAGPVARVHLIFDIRKPEAP